MEVGVYNRVLDIYEASLYLSIFVFNCPSFDIKYYYFFSTIVLDRGGIFMGAGLYGLTTGKTNKDFTKEDSWGKNQFNNAFPLALAHYMHDTDKKPVYFMYDEEGGIQKQNKSVTEIFGVTDLNNAKFKFEDKFTSYKELHTKLDKTDLIVSDSVKNEQTMALEIKLTVIPDQTTSQKDSSEHAPEIVVRPNTIEYQALKIISSFKDKLEVFDDLLTIYNDLQPKEWKDPANARLKINDIQEKIQNIFKTNINLQEPLVLHQVWKTKGKTGVFDENCFDLFIWTSFSLLKLYTTQIESLQMPSPIEKLSRPERTLIWLFLMICNYRKTGDIKAKEIVDEYTYNEKNDKAFSISGNLTKDIMSCDELKKPRIQKQDIKKIILDNGQDLLRPERRLDAAIITGENYKLFQ